MSDYTAIPSSTFETDKPVLGATHLAMYENLIAVTEGAPGAPPVQLDALEIAETTATGTIINGGAAVTITRPSTRSLFPNIAVTAGTASDLQVEVNDAGLILSNTGGGNVSYSVVWPYLRNTP